MRERAWVALVDDWELRGNGLGDVEELQVVPARRLMDLYDEEGVPATFNAETLQQLAHERYAAAEAGVAKARDAWLTSVREMTRRGYDVQLHVHPQWWQAEREGGAWVLDRRWSIADYDPAEVEAMIAVARDYLVESVGLARPVAFRSGGWAMGPPSRAVLGALRRNGIVIDVSVCAGLRYDGDCVRLDYTALDSPYAAYYPDHDDIRRLGDASGPVVEIPTQSVPKMAMNPPLLRPEERPPALPRRVVRALAARLRLRPERGAASGDAPEARPPGTPADPMGYATGRAREDFIIDFSANVAQELFVRALDCVLERAFRAPGPGTPFLVFENHTKDLQSEEAFAKVRAYVRHLKGAHGPAIRFVTLGDMARNLGLARPLSR